MISLFLFLVFFTVVINRNYPVVDFFIVIKFIYFSILKKIKMLFYRVFGYWNFYVFLILNYFGGNTSVKRSSSFSFSLVLHLFHQTVFA